MRLAGLLLAATIAAWPASPTQAQDAGNPGRNDEPEIVVTGDPEPPKREEVFEQARTVSRIGEYQLHEEALARFETPLCVDVVGIRKDHAETLAQRVRDNAASFGLKLGGTTCGANFVVAFASEGRSVLHDLRRKAPSLFSLVSASERTELLADSAPVRVLSTIETRYADGTPVPRWRGKEQLPSVKGRLDKLFLPTRRDIRLAVVVFDRDATLGMSIEQLADYATMRGLAHTRPAAGGQTLSTILSLFDEDVPPDGLTSFDRGYLLSLYHWRADLSSAAKLAGIRRHMLADER